MRYASISGPNYNQSANVYGAGVGSTSIETAVWDAYCQVYANWPAAVAPDILFNGTNVTGTTQSVVVGQQIALQASYSLPSGVSVTSQSWSVPGTTVGGFVGNVNSGSVTGTNFSNTITTTFYWVDANSRQVTFTLKTSDGNTYTANVTFVVAGPTSVTVTPTGQEFFIRTTPPAMIWGIQFSASASPPTGYTGTYTWIQLVQSYSFTWIYSDGAQPTVCSYTPGFDAGPSNEYPYASGLTSEDGPSLGLNTPPTSSQVEQTQSAQFKMYLMWNPNIGSGSSASIPVPLGSISWSTAGDVVWNSTLQAWNKKSGAANATTNGSFSPSSSYPTWQNPVAPCS